MVELSHPLNAEQKHEALNQVLGSQTFARTDKLKSFLRFVCEMEIAGRGAEINEYMIGVEALGRPESYSPGDDSAVRNRAYSLRQKLLEFYTQEQPAARVRIELPKGSYYPHFVAVEATPPPEEKQAEASTALAPVTTAPITLPESLPSSSPSNSRKVLLAFLAGVLLTAIVAALLYFSFSARLRQPHVAPVLREAWGAAARAGRERADLSGDSGASGRAALPATAAHVRGTVRNAALDLRLLPAASSPVV